MIVSSRNERETIPMMSKIWLPNQDLNKQSSCLKAKGCREKEN